MGWSPAGCRPRPRRARRPALALPERPIRQLGACGAGLAPCLLLRGDDCAGRGCSTRAGVGQGRAALTWHVRGLGVGCYDHRRGRSRRGPSATLRVRGCHCQSLRDGTRTSTRGVRYGGVRAAPLGTGPPGRSSPAAAANRRPPMGGPARRAMITPAHCTPGCDDAVPAQASLTIDAGAVAKAERPRRWLVRAWRPTVGGAAVTIDGGIDRPALEQAARARRRRSAADLGPKSLGRGRLECKQPDPARGDPLSERLGVTATRPPTRSRHQRWPSARRSPQRCSAASRRISRWADP
jgi:hypothetical protein